MELADGHEGQLAGRAAPGLGAVIENRFIENLVSAQKLLEKSFKAIWFLPIIGVKEADEM